MMHAPIFKTSRANDRFEMLELSIDTKHWTIRTLKTESRHDRPQMTIMSLLVILDVVVITASDDACDEQVSIMVTLGLHYACEGRKEGDGFIPGLYRLSGQTSFRQISWCLEAARLDIIMIILLWNLTGISAALLSMCLLDFRVIGKI